MSISNESPEAQQSLEPFAPRIERTPVPVELGVISDIVPIQAAQGSVWLLLNERGDLVRFDAGTGECVRVAKTDLDVEPERKAWNNRTAGRRLHVSARGDFAAVVNDYGQFGQVLDLRSGRLTMTLDGGDYHPETVPFSLAFAEPRDRTVLIHRTGWNRLDISDPSTGELLTERGPTSYESGQERPDHYLDFFHGGLHVSPGSKRLLDDGWVWHPMGALASWCIEPWLLENRWESEDGASKRDVAAGDDWDRAAAWLDDDRVAIYGIVEESDKMLAGARIFDASLIGPPSADWHNHGRWARELIAFPGPSGRFFSDGTWLLSSDASGLARWDPVAGELTGRIPGFEPTCFHRGVSELGQIVEQALVRVALR